MIPLASSLTPSTTELSLLNRLAEDRLQLLRPSCRSRCCESRRVLQRRPAPDSCCCESHRCALHPVPMIVMRAPYTTSPAPTSLHMHAAHAHQDCTTIPVAQSMCLCGLHTSCSHQCSHWCTHHARTMHRAHTTHATRTQRACATRAAARYTAKKLL